MNQETVSISPLSARVSAAGLPLGEYFQDARDTLRNAGKYSVKITAGVHEGSAVQLGSGPVKIGSGKDNDIVLFGAGVADSHMELSLPKGAFEKLKLTPIQSPVILEDGARVEVGQYVEIEAGSSVTIGDSDLYIDRVADPKKFIRPGLRLMAIICIILMLPLGYTLLSNAAVGFADASSRAIGAIGSTVEQTSRRYLGTSVGLSVNGTEDVTEAFTWTVRTKLEDLKLNHRLRAAATPDGSIRVSGNISDPELPRWTAFLQWYDSKTEFPPLIRDVNRNGIDNDLPSIKSVWLDDTPTVFFKDGTVGNVGASLKGGWKVVSINQNAVMIERDGAVISLTY